MKNHPKHTGALMLKHFTVDAARHDLVVDVEFYQMDLATVIETARVKQPEAFMENGMFLPSWSKFAANPVKAKGFFTNMLQAVFEGKGGDDSLNADLQSGRSSKEGTKVAMMFLPGSTTNKNITEIKSIAEQALRGFHIMLVSGADDISNATAEQLVKEAIETAEKRKQHVLILSAGMAQRSFSIPQITELYLAYDGGDSGATIQKISRTLTPDDIGKIGRVFSISFDSNRDDKFDALLIETAQNYKKNHDIKDLKQALGDVIHTVDIFKCTDGGRVKLEVDDYLQQALARKSIDRVIGKCVDRQLLTPEVIRALASGNINVLRAELQNAAERGKTRKPMGKKKTNNTESSKSKKQLIAAIEMIVTISENIDIIRFYGGRDSTIEKAFKLMDRTGASIQDEITAEFGVKYGIIKELVLSGIINRDLLDVKFAGVAA